ncbi:uncharacterized protein LOC5506625 isoform X2 [Nematostella vectensis]|uniref:uncharacterized protein LOC5506625 isoform X2 n=1 Tax=Nematostella vectensis TaxID=45351 RepID=UPI0013905DB5|nr:uncharacterized protein LOC5506625 isoform X2 [Nematostella vectensis]
MSGKRSRTPSLKNMRQITEMQNAARAGKFSEAEKKRLQAFLGELLRTGCLKGFKYFALYLRGREELICRVLNEPMSSEILSYYTSPTSGKMRSGSSSFTFDSPPALPRNDLSGYGFMDIGLPPASPSERDIDLKDDKSTLFLIACYARYNCPYVWVRSNHERLVCFSADEEIANQQKDSPLKLRSTSSWKKRDTKLWDIIAEIVKLCMYPAPLNPFTVDFKYFEGLPSGERLIATGAMASFLQKVVTSGEHAYNARVLDDLGELTRRHFKDLQTFTRQSHSAGANSQSYQVPPQQGTLYHQSGPLPPYSSQYQTQ